MESPRVIKFSRSDLDSACVLVQVTKDGPAPLDLTLEASEGDAPYFASLKHGRVASLRTENGPASETEWQAILRSVFSQEALPDIHATASVQEGSSMTITVRKQIQGITQRLGSISLECEPSRELDIFRWCIVSQDALEKSSEALAASVARAKELELTVRELRTQLDDLISTKRDDEASLLHKFSCLLNEKKVKIRHQQKIIAASAPHVPQQPSSRHRASESSPQPQPPPKRKAARSRVAKRKAAADVSSGGEEDNSGAMEVDKIKSEPEDSDRGILEDTDATASGVDEEDDDDDDDHDRHGGDKVGGSQAKGKAPGHADTKSHGCTARKASEGKAPEAPPPPRILPFARKKAAERGPAPKRVEPGTDSEDDEL
ncbi:hypothetical protein ESCO_005425 [Escovopsis weberi]|uniref:DNA repair protein XRCC4 n=1 Tax=Escovopsis weberi TaxID=150374 RepID=A0A0M8MX77_ESCWE|nr:hypothetical protein ESCO_005425 [Escovopsis weberi]